MRNILTCEDVQSMDLTFSTSYDNFGHEETIDLKAGGSAEKVTNANKQEFVSLYVDWYLNESVVSQFRPFYRGFYRVISEDSIRVDQSYKAARWS